MKAFLKTLIGGALGLGTLYVVGRICFEAGKDVAEVERQLANQDESKVDGGKSEHKGSFEEASGSMDNSPAESAEHETADEVLDTQRKSEKQTVIGRTLSKIKNAKLFLRAKKAFEGKGDRSPGILGSLLTNPDGAKIEAYVRNGGVQISVRPKAA